jgi:hypothetical protein
VLAAWRAFEFQFAQVAWPSVRGRERFGDRRLDRTREIQPFGDMGAQLVILIGRDGNAGEDADEERRGIQGAATHAAQ